jgi:hypothetical protein
MPQRFLRPGIRNSDRWNSVSREAQIAYIGIITLADDYGQYDARPSLLCAEIFTIWNDLHPDNPVDSAAFRRALRQLEIAKLIEIYEHPDGKSYLQVVQWQEKPRQGAKKKWGGEGFTLRNAADCGETPPFAASLVLVPSPRPVSVSATNGHTQDLDIEPPPGFPKSLEEAIAMGAPVGASPTTCELHYNLALSRGFLDRGGAPIRRFAHYVRSAELMNAGAQSERRAQNGASPAKPKKMGTNRDRFVWNWEGKSWVWTVDKPPVEKEFEQFNDSNFFYTVSDSYKHWLEQRLVATYDE